MKFISAQRHPDWISYLLIFNNGLFAMAMDIHLPSMPIMVHDLHTNEFMVQLVLILFGFGAIFSRLLWGPISDLYGRRKIMLLTIGIQIVGQFGCSIAPNIESLLIIRALQSLGAGISSVLATAIIADLYPLRSERVRILGLLEMSFPIAFVLAPILGAFLVEATGGWRANFFLILAFFILAWFLVYRYVPETHIHKRKESVGILFKTYFKLMQHVKFVSYSSMVGIIVAVYMMFVINAPFVYMTDYGLSVSSYAMYQLIPMLSNIGAVLVYRNIVEFVGVSRTARYGIGALSCLIPVYLAIGLVDHRWPPEVILGVICIQSTIVPFIIPGFTAKALDKFPDIKGMSSSVIGSIRTLFMSFGMLFGSYVVGSEIDHLFITMGLMLALVSVIYWTFHIKEVGSFKKQYR